MRIELDLPFPTSTNRLWQLGLRRMFPSKEYVAWKQEATGVFWQQFAKARPQPMGKFEIYIVLDRKRRGISDGDNRIKAVVDFCQMVRLVGNDRDCDGGGWRWGDAPTGCHVTLVGEPPEAPDDE